MPPVTLCDAPKSSLLQSLRAGGSYTDCFATEVAISVSQSDYVEAFYTTTLFKAERLVIRLLASTNSTDHEARELALGMRDTFAVWSVAQRLPNQVLLTDRTGRTSSWLMSEAGIASTKLYFGSAINTRVNANTGQREMSIGFRALAGFHDWYSRRLLQAAARRLIAGRASLK